MRYAAAELSDGFHLLGLPQRFLGFVAEFGLFLELGSSLNETAQRPAGRDGKRSGQDGGNDKRHTNQDR